MRYVIDAGVVVKWFIPEVDSAIAHELLDSELTSCSRNTNHQAALQAFAIFTFTV